MFEPLLGVHLPDHLLESVSGPVGGADRTAARRRVLIVGEVWPLSQAEHNAGELMERLLATGQVQLVAFGDFDEAQRPRLRSPPALRSRDEDRERREHALEELARRRIDLAEYVSLALNPNVPLVGVNEQRLLNQAFEARRDRGRSLVEHCHRALNDLVPVACSLGLRTGTWSQEIDREVCARGGPQLAELPETPRTPVLPLLQCMNRRLAQLRRDVEPPELLRDHRLLARAQASLLGVPALLARMEELELDPGLYPMMCRLGRVVRLEQLSPNLIRRQQAWLHRAVVGRLQGRIAPASGLTLLFESKVRQMEASGTGDPHLYRSRRPLSRCSEVTLQELVDLMRDAVQANEDPQIVTAFRLLELAAVFGLDDRAYSHFRRWVAAAGSWQRRVEPLRAYLGELISVRRDLLCAAAAAHGPQAMRRSLHLDRLRMQLSELDLLARESLSAREALNVLAEGDTAETIAADLTTLGAEVTPIEHELAVHFDQTCLAAARRFYDSSLRQAPVMADRLLSAMAGGLETAVLVCGAFHPQRVVAELQQQTDCSILIPALTPVERSGQRVDPEAIERAASSSRVPYSIHMVGPRFFQDADELRLSVTDPPETREWVRRVARKALLEGDLATLQPSGEETPSQECHICFRRAPVEERQVIQGRGASLERVLLCSECGRYVCTRCAGYEPVALFVGYGPKEVRTRSRWGRLVCPKHAVALGREARPILLHRGLDGHGWFQ